MARACAVNQRANDTTPPHPRLVLGNAPHKLLVLSQWQAATPRGGGLHPGRAAAAARCRGLQGRPQSAPTVCIRGRIEGQLHQPPSQVGILPLRARQRLAQLAAATGRGGGGGVVFTRACERVHDPCPLPASASLACCTSTRRRSLSSPAGCGACTCAAPAAGMASLSPPSSRSVRGSSTCSGEWDGGSAWLAAHRPPPPPPPHTHTRLSPLPAPCTPAAGPPGSAGPSPRTAARAGRRTTYLRSSAQRARCGGG